MSFDFQHFRQRPAMYVWHLNYPGVVNFLQGIDIGMNNGLLVGFNEWLEPRVGGWGEYAWPGMALMLAFPEHPGPPRHEFLLSDATADKHAIEALFCCIESYYDERHSSHGGGLRHIYLRYQMWKESKGRNDRSYPGAFIPVPNWWELEPKIAPRFCVQNPDGSHVLSAEEFGRAVTQKNNLK
jgi:hypothetical protein